MDWMTHIVFWHWWILAGMLLILELASPVFFFLWLGFSSAAVGFLLLVFPGIPVAAQLVLFGLLSIEVITRRVPKYFGEIWKHRFNHSRVNGSSGCSV